jgi:pimeloyl-ACP methyl ester carboxylesterase
MENLAEAFAAPALILCGRQDAIVGYRDAWPVIEDYPPHATFAVLDWGGHIVAPARPDLFRTLVVDWLDRIEATADS